MSPAASKQPNDSDEVRPKQAESIKCEQVAETLRLRGTALICSTDRQTNQNLETLPVKSDRSDCDHGTRDGCSTVSQHRSSIKRVLDTGMMLFKSVLIQEI